MKILGLISSKNDPASRYRIMQYHEIFKLEGHQLNCKIPCPLKESDPPFYLFRNKTIWKTLQSIGRWNLIPQHYFYDIVWQNRLLLNNKYDVEKHFKKPFVFDIDDAIWLSEGTQHVDRAITNATMVFAGNEYLAEYCSQFNKRVKIIPTVINMQVLKPLSTISKIFNIGWIGTESNFKYLELVKEPVLNFLKTNKDARLIIVSSTPPSTFSFDNNQIVFKKWEAEKENEHINEFSIGLMPLSDDEWTKGKCSFKMLQYMSCGIPVIVSPFGQNKKILSNSQVGIGAVTKDDWLSAFNELKNDLVRYNHYKEVGIEFIQNNYSIDKWAPQIIANFQKIS